MEVIVGIVGLALAVVIGVWQIRLARKQNALVETQAVEPVHGEHVALKVIWENLEPELQDAMTLAYNQAVRNGSGRISTRYFFGAVQRLKPDVLNYFPEESLPVPTDADLAPDHNPAEEDAPLSDCVNESLVQLTATVGRDRQVTLEDVFIDVAKHGTGASVSQLRTHGVDPDKIDQIVGQLGWEVVARPPRE